ncbi:hypothetical protein D3C86_2211160 [compost metagenome]
MSMPWPISSAPGLVSCGPTVLMCRLRSTFSKMGFITAGVRLVRPNSLAQSLR